jgi:hypothetical protein
MESKTSFELSDILHLSTHSLPIANEFFFLTDTLLSDGSFILHSLCHLFLKAQRNVLLVGLENNFQYYYTIGKKMKVNLLAEENRKLFHFIDATNGPFSWSVSLQDENVEKLPKSEMKLPENSEDFAKFLKLIDQRLEELEKNSEVSGKGTGNAMCCVLIDCINILANCISRQELVEWIQACHDLVQDYDGLFVILMHEDDEGLLKTIAHRSDFIFSAEPLESGFSKEVTGQISILCNTVSSISDEFPLCLHYKIQENNVKFFKKPIFSQK